MSPRANSIEAPRWACLALIALGFVAGAIGAVMSARYGQRMTVDEEGWWTQGGSMYVVSATAFVLSIIAGAMLRTRHWLGVLIGIGVLGGAFLCIAYTLSNSIGFSGHQVLGKSKLLESRQKVASDISSIQNDTIISERKELRESLFRTYHSIKDQAKKDDVMAQIKAINDTPVLLTVPSLEVPIVDARTTILNKLLGWDSEKAQALSAAALPILLVAIELIGPFLGTALWSHRHDDQRHKDRPPKSGQLPQTARQYTKREARADVIAMTEAGVEFGSNLEAASKWGVSPPLACKWLRDFRSEGLIRREWRDGLNGRTKAVVAPRRTNGNGHTLPATGTA